MDDSGEEFQFDKVRRTPIVLTPHTVMLVQLFTMKEDNLSDMWSWGQTDPWEDQKAAAEQFLEQLEDQWTPAFLISLRRAITDKLAKQDEKYGTKFAGEL